MCNQDDPLERFKKELNSLDDNCSKLVDYGLGPERVTFQVFPATDENEIVTVEHTLGVLLPTSFRSFLTNWNGAIMYARENAPGIRIFGTQDLLERNRIWQKYELQPEDRVPGLVIFADWEDGNYSIFDTNRMNTSSECPILDGFHEFLPRQWEAICFSFGEWLTRLVEADGRLFWLEQEIDKEDHDSRHET